MRPGKWLPSDRRDPSLFSPGPGNLLAFPHRAIQFPHSNFADSRGNTDEKNNLDNIMSFRNNGPELL